MSSINWLKIFKENAGSIFAFLLIAVLTHLDANAAMLFGEGLGVYAFILLLIILIRFISWIFRRNSEKIQKLKKTCFYFAYAVALCAISWQGISYINHTIDVRFRPVIEKLEAYKTANGTYPEKLEIVVNPAPQCPGLTVPFMYHRSDKGDSYSLLCMTMGFNHHEYFSNNPEHKWKDWD